MNKTGSWNEDKKGIRLDSATLLIEWELSQLEGKDSHLGTHGTRKQPYANKRVDRSDLEGLRRSVNALDRESGGCTQCLVLLKGAHGETVLPVVTGRS